MNKNSARITFYRPTSFGMFIQAPIAEYVNNDVKFCGITSEYTRFHWVGAPGEHIFVIGGESSSILKANLDAGKNYYVQVMPKFGFWKSRFCFEPMSQRQLAEAKNQKEIKKCSLVSANANSNDWFSDNHDSILKKIKNALNDFENVKDEKKSKFILSKDDGIATLF